VDRLTAVTWLSEGAVVPLAVIITYSYVMGRGFENTCYTSSSIVHACRLCCCSSVAAASDRTSSGYFLRREQDEVVKRLEQRIADWTKLPLVNGEPFHVSSSGSRSAPAMAAAGVAATVAAAVRTAAGPCGTKIRRCGAGVAIHLQGLARLSREAAARAVPATAAGCQGLKQPG
jgi:hypothetical protein